MRVFGLAQISSAFVPMFVTFILLCLNYVPFSFGAFGIIRPDLALVVLYYWISNKPRYMPFLGVMIIGLTADVIYNTHFGTHAIPYLMVWVITLYGVRQNVLQSVIGWWVIGVFIIVFAHTFYWLMGVAFNGAGYREISYIFSIPLSIGFLFLCVVMLNPLDKILK